MKNESTKNFVGFIYWLTLVGSSCGLYFWFIYDWLVQKKFFSEYERAMSVPEDMQYAMMAGLILGFVVLIMGAGISAIIHIFIIKNLFPNFVKSIS
ncbi:hypothetical protein vBSdyM006_125 [Shigella phage vB_SdyM_006]|nr:hypothetical protein vBSdyM006_125 [Shigella phage vB_SdyM_006]